MKAPVLRNVLRLLSVVVLTTALAGSVFSTVHAATVWYVATTGDDTNTCSDLATPCKTITGAYHQARAGDTINVAAGTYNEEVVFNTKGMSLIGAGIDQTIIDATGLTTYCKPFWTDTGFDASIEGVTLTGAASGYCHEAINAGALIDGGQGGTITITNTRITGNQHGIVSAGNLVLNHVLIDNNTINGVWMVSGADTNFTNVTIVNNGKDGILQAGTTTATVKNSIIAYNTAVGIDNPDAGATPTQVTYSDVYSNDGAAYSATGVAVGTGVIAADPLFVSASDYQLQSTSPVINSGDPNTADNDPDGTRNDMGAFFYDSSGTPTDLTASATSLTAIHLAWTDNATDETSFSIERSPNGTDNWTEIATPAANTTSYDNTGLTCGTTYFYRVRSYRASGDHYSPYSNVADATTVSCLPPADPSSLTAVAASQTQIDLSWTDNSNDENDFGIERSANGTTGWSQITTVTANTTSYQNTGLTCGNTYYYRVRAHRSSDNSYSGYSNIANATTSACMPEIELRYARNGTAILDGNTTPSVDDGTDFGATDINAMRVSHTFNIYNLGSGALHLTGKPIVSISGANAADFTVTLQPANSVHPANFAAFRVVFDPSGVGVRSATITIANNDSNENPYDFSIQGVGWKIPAKPVLTAPKIASFTNITPVTFEWGAASSAVTYQIQVSKDSGFTQRVIDETTSAPTFTADTLLDRRYFWRVRGVNAYNVKGPWSAAIYFYVDHVAPQVPNLISPSNNRYTGDRTPYFVWSTVAGTFQYTLQIASDEGFTDVVYQKATNGYHLEVPDRKALPYGAYFWRVEAADAAGNISEWSEPRAFFVTLMRYPLYEAFTQDRTPTLGWSIASGITRVAIEVSTDSAFATTVAQKEVAASRMAYTVGPLDYGQYYWHMRYLKGGVWSEWLPTGTFTVTPALPHPVLTSPRSGTILTTGTPTLTWNAVPNTILPDANTYRVQISTASFGTAVQNVVVTDNSFTPAALPAGKYYWRVKTINSLGYTSAWSGIWSFTIK